jgi:hypothetical protein
MLNTRQSRMEAEHSSKNSFVKAEQAKQAKYAGQAPKMEERFMEFNAAQMNNGAHAQELAKKLTAGIDDVAFPVRGAVDPDAR